jgi:hypothetical protein
MNAYPNPFRYMGDIVNSMFTFPAPDDLGFAAAVNPRTNRAYDVDKNGDKLLPGSEAYNESLVEWKRNFNLEFGKYEADYNRIADANRTADVNNMNNVNIVVLPQSIELTNTMDKAFEGKIGGDFQNGLAASISAGTLSDGGSILKGSKHVRFEGADTIELGAKASNWDPARMGKNAAGEDVEIPGGYVDVNGDRISRPNFKSMSGDNMLELHSNDSVDEANAYTQKNLHTPDASSVTVGRIMKQAIFEVDNGKVWFDEMRKTKVYGEKKVYEPSTMDEYAEKVRKVIGSDAKLSSLDELQTSGSQSTMYGTGPGETVADSRARGAKTRKSDLESLKEADYKKKYNVTKAEARKIIEVAGDDRDVARVTTKYLDRLHVDNNIDPTKRKKHAEKQEAFPGIKSYEDLMSKVKGGEDLKGLVHPSVLKQMKFQMNEDNDKLLYRAKLDVTRTYHNSLPAKEINDMMTQRQNEYSNRLGNPKTEPTIDERSVAKKLTDYFPKKKTPVTIDRLAKTQGLNALKEGEWSDADRIKLIKATEALKNK